MSATTLASFDGPLYSAADAEWRWLLSVNLEGLVNGYDLSSVNQVPAIPSILCRSGLVGRPPGLRPTPVR